MSAHAFRDSKNDLWTTMTAGDAGICLDYAAAFDPTRGQAWEDAFLSKAKQLGYRPAKTACDCHGRVHHADCGLAKLVVSEPLVWPHEDFLGVMQSERLPSPIDPFARPPVEARRSQQVPVLAPIPIDAEYTGSVPLDDPDDLADAA